MGSEQPTPLTDEELARQGQAGSLAAFEELVCRYEAPVYRFVCQRCGNPDDAQDLAQATFVSAFRKLRQFTPGRSFRSWLFAIARNRTIDFLRARRTHESVEPGHLVDSADPATAMEGHEQADALWALARCRLRIEQFEVLWLRYQEDLSVREIARTLRRTETGVKVTLFRARQKLAVALRGQDRPAGMPEARHAERAPGTSRGSVPTIHHQPQMIP